VNQTDLQKSIVLITSSNPGSNHHFGTGFVIRQTVNVAHILTCSHVVDSMGGTNQVMVDGREATLVACGKDLGLDLAVLRVEGLWNKPVLQTQGSGLQSKDIIIPGFQKYAKSHLIRPLRGVLADQGELQTRSDDRIPVWDLKIVDDYNLENGYSGSPIVDEVTGQVLGIVSHKQGDKIGLAISIRALDKIFQIFDQDQLYEVLLKLGYQKQVRTFRSLIENHSIAAFLIHGFPAHGQRWLLNRLIGLVPRYLQGRVISIGLDRGTRKRDISSLWRELGGRVGLSGGGQPDPDKIAQRVYQCWHTQNVFLVFHEVDCMPENYLRQIVQEFWQPLAKEASYVSHRL
jgi:hypothetical protein